MRVLLVDDSSTVRERLKALFSEVPKVEIVGEAKDEPEALELLHRLNPEVMVLDIQMPGANGIDLLQKVKKEKRSLLVVVLTNLSDSQYRRKCLDAGADFFFDKSSEFNKVIQVLNQYDLNVPGKHGRT
jgi:DNA-binding NarL/FixJ family response regulator